MVILMIKKEVKPKIKKKNQFSHRASQSLFFKTFYYFMRMLIFRKIVFRTSPAFSGCRVVYIYVGTCCSNMAKKTHLTIYVFCLKNLFCNRHWCGSFSFSCNNWYVCRLRFFPGMIISYNGFVTKPRKQICFA